MEELISSIIKETTVTLAISGGGYIEHSVKGFNQATYLKNPNEFIELLNQKQKSITSENSIL